MALMTKLPDEVILRIIAGLGGSIEDLTNLQLVSLKFYQLARDGEVWRNLCFEGSIAGRRHNRSTIPKTIPSRQVQALQAEAAAITSTALEASLQETADNASVVREQTRAREITKWDPRFTGENADWYSEYIARAAPVAVDWAYQDKSSVQEIEGLALHRSSGGVKQAVARFDDGHVGVWAFDGGDDSECEYSFTQSDSKILKSGYSDNYEGILQDQASMSASAITDCVSIDGTKHKAYVAVDCQLNEVDLNTLQLSSCASFPRPISALSNIPANAPLIVGTSSGLYRHDPRVAPRWFDGSQALQHQQSIQHPSSAPGPLLPLSILQSPISSFGSGPAEIYAAGRFPSILMYDQRTFPRVSQSIWSGADLSCLSLMPQILPQIPPEGDILGANPQSSTKPAFGHTLLAGGAKNGKGSLELYGIDRSAARMYGNIRNRTMASRVKLLSVVPHGKRICTSDADGNIKWFERDGFNLVRQVNTNDLLPKQKQKTSPAPSPGLFGTQQDNGDVVQKLIPLGKEENADVLVWAGNRAGVLKIGKGFRDQEREDGNEDETALASHEYEEEMRRLLEAQAMEARRMQDFGMQ